MDDNEKFTTDIEKRREIEKPIGGDSVNEEPESPKTPQDMGQTSISGHTPNPSVDDDLLEEAQDEVDLYTEYDDNFEGEISIADQIMQGEDRRRKSGS